MNLFTEIYSVVYGSQRRWLMAYYHYDYYYYYYYFWLLFNRPIFLEFNAGYNGYYNIGLPNCLQAGCPSCHQTDNVKAMKEYKYSLCRRHYHHDDNQHQRNSIARCPLCRLSVCRLHVPGLGERLLQTGNSQPGLEQRRNHLSNDAQRRSSARHQ